MTVRHVDGARAQFDLLGFKSQTAQEHQARGDVLRQIGNVLANISFGVTESVSQDDGLTILAQRLAGATGGWMQRHHECTEFHGLAHP